MIGDTLEHMPPEKMIAKFEVQFDHKLKVWVLVLGGWRPIQLAAVDILVVDRNITSALEALEAKPNRQDLVADKWWLGYLNRPTPLLNPILCASEGKWRSTPTFEQFCQELRRSTLVLSRSLPNAGIIRHPEQHLEQLYAMCVSQASRTRKEVDFLVVVCPLLVSRTSRANERHLEVAILSAADQSGISRQSLCCMAALSVLYERPDGREPRVGRGILKPTRTYSQEDAYNALSDLHGLEFFAAGCAMSGFTSGLCTRDKYLAAFWVALGVQFGTWSENKFSATYTPRQELFPRLNDEEIDSLFKRIKT